jgi:hypothetical protein
MAYGIGIHPRELEAMQPGEFWLMLEAAVRRQKEQDRRAAYFLSYLMAPYMKEGTKIDIEDIVAPLWGEAEERKKQKEVEARAKRIEDRAVLEQEFAWALRRK